MAFVLSCAVLAGLVYLARRWLNGRREHLGRLIEADAEYQRLLPEWRAEIDRMERGSV